MNKNRKLVLENGKVFDGYGFGGSKEVINELVFNTSVVGYQEILSDPKNYKKVMCLTYPVIGNYGLNDTDFESKGLTVSGLIVREYNDIPSNFRFTYELSEVMSENDIPGIYDVDTREITRLVREQGVMKAMICDIAKPVDEALKEINEYVVSEKVVDEVSSKKVWYSRTTNPLYTVVAIDCGIKKSLVKILNTIGCNVVVVPNSITKEQLLKYKPNGLLISDGPGNPEKSTEVVELINEMKYNNDSVIYDDIYHIADDMLSGDILYAILPSNYVEMYAIYDEYIDFSEDLNVLFNKEKEQEKEEEVEVKRA